MIEFLYSMEAWHWGVIAAVFLMLEIAVSGIYMLWMGIAAAVVAVISYIFPDLLWYWEGMIWCVVSIASVYFWRSYRKANPKETEDSLLNKRGDSCVGKVVTIDTELKGGRTRVKLGDTTWSAKSDDALNVGDDAKVISVDGSTLVLEKV